MKLDRWLFAVLVAWCVVPCAAQTHGYPSKNTPGVCTDCLPPGKGKNTWPFKDPLVAHAGRYVDSSTTRNAQNLGMRTVRAHTVRLSPARNRIYVRYGEAIAAFSLPGFFEEIRKKPLPPVSVVKTGSAYGRYGQPLETVARPHTFFYAEASASGWNIESADAQAVLTDFDVDDRGNVYAGTFAWGWGIAFDDNARADASHMEYRIRVETAPFAPDSIVAFKFANAYYTVVSAARGARAGYVIYNVTNTTAPKVVVNRAGKQHGIVRWARHDPAGRLAVVNTDGVLRIYDYGSFFDGGKPLAELPPSDSKKTFRDLSFDEQGTLWVAESTLSATAANRLWQVTPAANGYTRVLHDVYDGSFRPDKVAAQDRYVAVGGQTPDNKTELRLFRLGAAGTPPVLVDTDNFFRRFYHAAPSGYVSASSYQAPSTSLSALQIVRWAGKTYLLYSANGLGDVYQLQ